MSTIKKIALIILPIFMLLSCATYEGPASDFRMFSFSVYDGSENLIQTVNISYNEMNKPSEITALDGNGDLLSRKSMKYSDRGKLLILKNSVNETTFIQSEYRYSKEEHLVEVRTVNDKNDELGVSTYINDERGNPLEWLSEYSGSGEQVHFIKTYDESDRLVKSSELDKLGNVIYFSVSQYDDRGNEISYSIYSPEGNLDQQLFSFYEEDQLIKTEVKDETGALLYHTDYDLNELNKPVLISLYNQYEDLYDHVIITYDVMGNELTRESYNYEGKLTDKIVREYDEEGNNITFILYDGNNSIISITRNNFVNEPLHMDDEEFSTLVFKL